MEMACLDVFRIKESQTAMNILENGDNCLLRYGIKCNVGRVVCDNAANMKKAFEIELIVPEVPNEVGIHDTLPVKTYPAQPAGPAPEIDSDDDF